ncbi:hypothetical protein PIROE2DRAFT_29413, partial [Piromyces sp. E2]
TPLFFACYSGKLDVVTYLVEQGANVNKENRKGATPLFNACIGGHEAVVQYLVEHGADVN